jgi:3-phenylpropionate/trans-cinnamate dioxygenase ferredoxin reductase component
MLNNVVVAGGGQAGFQTAMSLRQLGFKGALTIVGDESALPYQRPPLSKAYLLGKSSADALSLRPTQFFVENDIGMLAETRVSSIDGAARRVLLESGGAIEYDHLMLALGSRNRPLPIPGSEMKGVVGLRSRADADAISEYLAGCQRVAIVGAGFIGLKFAAVASTLGKRVDVFELSERVMSRAVSGETSAFFERAHQAWDVNLNLRRSIVRINGESGRVSSVVTSDGETIPTDLVLVGIGVLPNSELAASAGLETHDGIKVDSELVTTDPYISAIGDCASFPLAGHDRQIRLESVQNAIDQARLVAARLMGQSTPYRAVPWFWSDQKDLKLQIAGLSLGADQFVRVGNTQSMSVYCFANDRLVAVESVNRGADHMAARKILGYAPTYLSYQDLESANFSLKECLAAMTKAAA